MPIDWKTAESRERLLASLLIAHRITRPNYNHIAAIFGQNASYDAIESQFRRIRQVSKQLVAEATQRGVDLNNTPRGRQKGSDQPANQPASALLPKREADQAPGSSTSSGPQSRKRAPRGQPESDRKKIKKEPLQKAPVIDLSQDTDTEDEAEAEDETWAIPSKPAMKDDQRRPPRQARPTASTRRSLFPPKGKAKEISHPGSLQPLHVESSPSDEDDEIESPSPKPRQPPLFHSQHLQTQSFETNSTISNESEFKSESSPSPSPPIGNQTSHSTAPLDMDEKPGMHDSNARNTAEPRKRSHQQITDSSPWTTKLYREPVANPSIATSVSSDKAPFLPQRSASRSSSSFPPHFSQSPARHGPRDLYHGTDDMVESHWFEGLDLERDDHGIPILDPSRRLSPLPPDEMHDAADPDEDGSYPRLSLDGNNNNNRYRASSKSTTSKSTSSSGFGGAISGQGWPANRNKGLRRSQTFMSQANNHAHDLQNGYMSAASGGATTAAIAAVQRIRETEALSSAYPGSFRQKAKNPLARTQYSDIDAW